MTKPKIAILGASGIGRYHAREFHNAGCDVTAILGSTKESSEKTAKELQEQFGISSRPYHSLENLLANEQLNAVSICTPPRLHSYHVRKCLEANLHVLCEKPFVLDSQHNNYKTAESLVKLAEEKNRILAVNTQWASIPQYLSREITSPYIRNFSMHMAPTGIKGIDLLTECIPHLNSLLIKLIPDGVPEKIRFPIREEDKILICFNYKNNSRTSIIQYSLKNKEEKPTNIKFSINGIELAREIGKEYSQQLIGKGRLINLQDPLKTSIRSFVSSLSGEDSPLVSPREILKNTELQDMIIRSYQKKVVS